MWSGSSSVICSVSLLSGSPRGRSKDGAKGFNLCGDVPMAGEGVSSWTQEVEVKGLKLYDHFSMTVGVVFSWIQEGVLVLTQEAGGVLIQRYGSNAVGNEMGLHRSKDILRK